MAYIEFSQLFGIVSTVLAVGILFNLSDARKMAKEMVSTPSGYILAGVLPLIFGCWTVLQSNHWVLGWPLVVTIIGWMMFLFGIFRLWFATIWLRLIQRGLDEAPVLFGLFGLIFGLLLLYVGFVTHPSILA